MSEQVNDTINKMIQNNKELKAILNETKGALNCLGATFRIDSDKRVEEAYQRGLDDAWEAARKVALNSNDGGLGIEDLDEIFDCYTLQQVFKGYTVQQTIAKLKAYEEKQKADDEIKVGDEVRRKNASENESGGIVTKDWENSYFIMWTDGSSGKWDKDRVVKTGRHFNIGEILEGMNNGG